MFSRIGRHKEKAKVPAQRRRFYEAICAGGKLLDVGCLGFAEVLRAECLGRNDIQHSGVDYMPPETGDIPPGFDFRQANLAREGLPFPDDSFDAVVASHVVEHIADPISLLRECVRVCKPGGMIYVEAPSERSLLLPGMPFDHKMFYSLSFYDDPTHISRPWTPQSFYRLSCYLGCRPLETAHLSSWKHLLALLLVLPWILLTRNGKRLEHLCWCAFGWSCYVLLQKPPESRGDLGFHYFVPAARLQS